MGSARELHPLSARDASLKRERFIPLRGSSRESFIPKTRAFRARFPQEGGVDQRSAVRGEMREVDGWRRRPWVFWPKIWTLELVRERFEVQMSSSVNDVYVDEPLDSIE